MATKTYLPGLRLACNFLKSYVNRNQVKLEQNLPEGVYDLVLLMLEAVDAVLIALGYDEPNP